MNNSKGGFENNTTFEIKFDQILNTRNSSAVVRKIICTSTLNEEKYLQE